MLEEAKKRDHRKLGKELGIFTFDDEVKQFGLIEKNKTDYIFDFKFTKKLFNILVFF
jgi:threonyl-tRNA synthetase